MKMAPVHIKVIPFIKGCLFEGGQIYKVDDTTVTWREVLERIGLHLDPLDRYWIRNPSRKVMAVQEDTVEDFISKFKKRTMNLYIVHVMKAKENWVHHSEKTAEAIANRQSKPEQPGTSARSCARILSHASDAAGNKTAASKGARSGTSSFVQDGPEFPKDPGFDENVPASGADFDDSASMLSQDSQDDGGDLKASIIRKLGDNINNGDLVLAKKEFQEMKERGKYMKVARHIPRGLAVLDVFFDQ